MLSGRIPIGKVREFEAQKVTIGGFVEHVRKLKNIFFLIVRDFDSSIQVVFPKSKLTPPSKESVVLIQGIVSKKQGSFDYEIIGETIQLLSKAEKSIPIELGDSKVSEERHRMRYRYLDLRRREIKENLVFNSRAKFIASTYLHSLSFTEITTPILSFPSKEGAQTFATTPNSVSPVSFTLAQSPQMYKQLLMIGGFEKYFQFSTSFRAEKLREDRQFEFTQLDIEMALSTRENLFRLIEVLIQKICSELLKNTLVPEKFPIITYRESLFKYGTDKPDLRNKLEIFELYEKMNIPNKSDNLCFCILVEKTQKLSDSFLETVDSEIKYFEEENSRENDESIVQYFRTIPNHRNSLIFYIKGDRKNYKAQLQKMGELRTLIWKKLNNQTSDNSLSFVWIVDWPYFDQISPNQLKVTHHPFTLPNISKEKGKNHLDWTSLGYDLVLNGVEIASGSERITDSTLQERIFQLLGLSEIQIQETFGWFLEALRYGAPPHLGIAIGWERLLQTILHLSSIREVIAFPKNSRGVCGMSSVKVFK